MTDSQLDCLDTRTSSNGFVFRDTASGSTYGLWWPDIIKLVLSEDETNLVIEHSTGQVDITGRNLARVFLHLHRETVSELRTSQLLPGENPSAPRITSIVWLDPQPTED
jgi:hypothetical protein